jgi:NTP pyrophosphatase (non-canonical NTP hydrolase)
MPADSIAELTRLVLQFRDERDWAQFHNSKDMALSLTLEATELLELMQWRNGPALEAHLRSKKEELGDELSDVLYWVLEIAHAHDIDLAEAFRTKMAKNVAKYPIEKARGLAKKYTEL